MFWFVVCYNCALDCCFLFVLLKLWRCWLTVFVMIAAGCGDTRAKPCVLCLIALHV